MLRRLSILAVVGAILLTACGTSPLTRPAPPATRAALRKLVKPFAKGPPKGVRVHVWSAQVDAADPHFARAMVGLTGGPYGGGRGDTALVVAMQAGGHWSLIVGPGSAFDCKRPTAKVVRDLLCSGPFG